MWPGNRSRAIKGWLAACGTATAAIYVLGLLLFVIAAGSHQARPHHEIAEGQAKQRVQCDPFGKRGAVGRG